MTRLVRHARANDQFKLTVPEGLDEIITVRFQLPQDRRYVTKGVLEAPAEVKIWHEKIDWSVKRASGTTELHRNVPAGSFLTLRSTEPDEYVALVRILKSPGPDYVCKVAIIAPPSVDIVHVLTPENA